MKKRIVIIITLIIAVVIIAVVIDNLDNKVDPVDETAIVLGEIRASMVELEQPEYKINYPEFRPYDNKMSVVMNDYMNQLVLDFIDEATTKTDPVANETAKPYTLNVAVEQFSGQNIQFYVLNEHHYTGGANENHNLISFNFDKKERLVKLSDLISKESDFKTIMKDKLAAKEFDGQAGAEFLDLTAIDSISLDEFNFSLNQDVITIYLGEYIVGPGVLGDISVDIPIFDLNT